ncbi:MAG: hypothetical protein NZ959_09385, partial [Armatimonadetes bacterium]|nr:hypothetical protein [Armatimonadota bacterium]MDW8122201.1 hypothetical protein [Armatimonadota bacterium]
WFYGWGLAEPYRISYEDAVFRPLLAVFERVSGFGFWAFQRPNLNANIVWYDEKSNAFQFGPTYLGLRDGFRDACLVFWASNILKIVPLVDILSERTDALFRIGWVTRNHYRYRTIVNLKSPLLLNELRRRLLRTVAQRAPNG